MQLGHAVVAPTALAIRRSAALSLAEVIAHAGQWGVRLYWAHMLGRLCWDAYRLGAWGLNPLLTWTAIGPGSRGMQEQLASRCGIYPHRARSR